MYAEVVDTGDGPTNNPVVEQICSEIAEEVAEAGPEIMLEMVANEGQETLIDELIGLYIEACDELYEGELLEIIPSHPEAVMEIADVGNELLAMGHQQIQELREAESAASAASGGGEE